LSARNYSSPSSIQFSADGIIIGVVVVELIHGACRGKFSSRAVGL
jgi:hypothetical protein